jgi:hypothetical protein
LRRGDLTLRKPHYQTSLAGRQPLAKSSLIATIHRDEALASKGIIRLVVTLLRALTRWLRDAM